ncbi:PaaI family thioesterase [Microbacterium halotolerans]|uniref:PaaI family thioesterase n=1 Tax=Microbacterium halotolerans TaxID=246613 RepID=UPI000E6AC70F|nr:hotdog fold thioesterase [Microbacterium halotolerans]
MSEVDGLTWARGRGLGPLGDKMGIELVEFGVDRAVATMPVEGNQQGVGLLHGGAYVVLGESLGSMAANLHCGPDRLAVGVDINATHTSSATDGIVTGVCTPIHLGGSMTVHEIVITNEQGKRCSTVRITNAIRNRPGFSFYGTA